MAERPILFSSSMVRAILAGTKTQTRRMIRGRVDDHPMMPGALVLTMGKRQFWLNSQVDHPNHAISGCPFGAPGDRLWVRETFYCDHAFKGDVHNTIHTGDAERDRRAAEDEWAESTIYRAHGEPHQQGFEDTDGFKWVPSIHMPRWASRITLEITEVRVERLQDITEEDARAEGVEPCDSFGADQPIAADHQSWTHGSHPHVLEFAIAWDTLYADQGFGWKANPWVWVISFKRVQP